MKIKIIECPRDAMQGIASFIPTRDKARYINQLLRVGFDTIDFGSFVSARAIPQLRDTHDVIRLLDPGNSKTRLLAIVANLRGAEQACAYEVITFIGFPLSVSETFQKRNTNRSIVEAMNELEKLQDICVKSGKTLVTYISMAFGNPYGDRYDEEVVVRFTDILHTLGVGVISLADTIGAATPDQVGRLYGSLSSRFPDTEFGAHLHSRPAGSKDKIEAAFRAGCRRFDGAMKGFGGCPMAKDELVGNLATETIVDYLTGHGVDHGLNMEELREAERLAAEVFPLQA